MCNCEQFVQVAHQKWAIEGIAHFFWANRPFALLVTTNEPFVQNFLTKIIFFYTFLLNEWFAHSLFFNKRCERITQFAHQKWATMSNLLTKNEWMSESLVFSANRSFALFFANNEQFAQKTDERIPNHAKNQGENSQPWDKHKKSNVCCQMVYELY